VDLVSGANTIKLQIPAGYSQGPNVDHMKIEGLHTVGSTAAFRNPPQFMSERLDVIMS
jgi:hypothetical protein